MVWYNQLVDDAVGSRGVPEGWLHVKGLRVTPQSYGYGRYFRFSGVDVDIWFGVNHERWAGSGDTPLWLDVSRIKVNIDVIGRELNVQIRDRWVPIYPKRGVEYPEVLEDVVSQLKAIADVLLRPG